MVGSARPYQESGLEMATKETVQIVGIELNEGVSKKTGNPYSIGVLYTMTKLAPPMAGGVAKGYMGDRYENVDAEIIRSISHNTFPLNAELTKESVMRFGKRQEMVTHVQPLAPAKDAAK